MENFNDVFLSTCKLVSIREVDYKPEKMKHEASEYGDNVENKISLHGVNSHSNFLETRMITQESLMMDQECNENENTEFSIITLPQHDLIDENIYQSSGSEKYLYFPFETNYPEDQNELQTGDVYFPLFIDDCDPIGGLFMDDNYGSAFEDVNVAISGLRRRNNISHLVKYYRGLISYFKSKLAEYGDLAENLSEQDNCLKYHPLSAEENKVKIVDFSQEFEVEDVSLIDVVEDQVALYHCLANNQLGFLYDTENIYESWQMFMKMLQIQRLKREKQMEQMFYEREVKGTCLPWNKCLQYINEEPIAYLCPNIRLREKELFWFMQNSAICDREILKDIKIGIFLENDMINAKLYKRYVCDLTLTENSKSIAILNQEKIHCNSIKYGDWPKCNPIKMKTKAIPIGDGSVKDEETMTDHVDSKSKELENWKKKSEQSISSLNETSQTCEALKAHLKIKEDLLVNSQEQLCSLYVELEKKNQMMEQWQGEINFLYTSLNQREKLIKEMYGKNKKIYEMEQKLNCMQELLDEKDLTLKCKENRINSLQSVISDKNSVILGLKNELAEKEVTANFLHTVQTSLATELQDKEHQCEKLLLRLNDVSNDLEEVKEVKKNIQLQLMNVQKCVDNLLEEKEELECNLCSHQVEICTLKDEFENVSKDIPSYKEELNYTRIEIRSLTEELELKQQTILKQQANITKLEKMNEAKQTRMQVLLEQMQVLEDEIHNKEADEKERKKALTEKVDQTEVTALKQQLFNNKNNINKLQIQSEEKDGKIQFLHTLLITIQNTMKKDENKPKVGQDQTAIQSEKIGTVENKLHLMSRKLKRIQKENESNQHQITLLDKEIEAERQIKQNKDLCILNLRSQVFALQKKLQDTVLERDEKNLDITALHSQMQTLQNKIGEFQKENEDKETNLQIAQAEVHNLHDEIEIFNEINKLKEEKIGLLVHQLNDTRIELDKKEIMISNMQIMINEFQKSEMEKKAVVDRLNLNLAKSLSLSEKFPLIIQNLQWEIKKLKSKINFEEMDMEFMSSLNKTEREAAECHLQFMESKSREFASIFQVLSDEKVELQRKYNAQLNLKTQLEKAPHIGNLKDMSEYKMHCLEFEIKILHEQMEAKEKAMLTVTESQKRTEMEKHLAEIQLKNFQMTK